MSTETIIAQCTPSGSGALALLRISGPDAFSIVSRCAHLSSKASLETVATHTIHHGWVIDNQKNKLDEVLFLAMRAPRTFTGQDTVEITCHNNPFLIETLIQRIIISGARLAHPGEFTRCAVENNKIDLLQAEAINEVIQANNQQALKKAFLQIEGSLSYWIERLEKDLLNIIVLCEASFEFLEEDIDFTSSIIEKLDALVRTVCQLNTTFDQQKLVRQGVRIALLGTVNAGKSSLFNKLVGANRAIVTPLAGTTRDVIEAGMYQPDGSYWTFVDTAGLRNTNNMIEKEGIVRSKQEAALADLILLVIDGSKKITPQEESFYQELLEKYSTKIMLIVNKNDLPEQPLSVAHNHKLSVSVVTENGLDQLRTELTLSVQHLLAETDCPFLLTRRQATLLTSFKQEIMQAHQMLSDKPVAYELVAHHLKNALALLTELTGKTISEKALDLVFREFCIGK